jgi:hypothetical protein
MGWWFGRKSAPADVRPFVPAWLKDCSAGEEGFARSLEGMAAYVKADSIWAVYRAGGWELGVLRGSAVDVGGQQVIASRAGAIASATGGITIDSEARAVLDQILEALRHHGLIET